MNATVHQYHIPIYKVQLVRDSNIPSEQRHIRSAADATQLLRTYLEGTDREHFVVILLDTKNKIIGINTISTGSINASVVHPREVFKPAIVSNANAIICGHNHPSGDPLPSKEDRVLTQRLFEGGKLLGIAVLDHVIIGDGTERSFSFADEGLLQ
jgi:DNA repair protein RadC